MNSPATPHGKAVDLTELARTTLFRQVSMAQVAALLKFCPVLELSQGDKLIVPGQTVDKVFILLQGRLQVFDGTSLDSPVGQIEAGECVGLSSFVDRQPCHVTITSDGICRLLPIDEKRLVALVNTPTVFSRNLLFMLIKYMRSKAAREAAEAAPPPPVVAPDNHVDPLTGLHNQRWLDETLDRLIMRAATDRAPLSIIAVDLLEPAAMLAQHGQDDFDKAMREMAGRLKGLIRPTDMMARHASGRFVLLLPDADENGAKVVMTRIEEALNSQEAAGADAPVSRPMEPVLGNAMMKSFVAGRKLVEDAMVVMERNRTLVLDNRKAMAEAAAAEAAAAAELAAAVRAAELAEAAAAAELAAAVREAELAEAAAEAAAAAAESTVLSGIGNNETVSSESTIDDGAALPADSVLDPAGTTSQPAGELLSIMDYARAANAPAEENTAAAAGSAPGHDDGLESPEPKAPPHAA